MENLSGLHQTCLMVFGEVSKASSYFVLPLFLGRIVFSNVLGEGSQALAALKAAVVYFSLIAGFPFILEILFSIPASYLPVFGAAKAVQSPDLLSGGFIPFALDQIVEVVLAALYWLVYYLHVFFMLVMCSMAPVVFLTSTFLSVGIGIEIFLGLLIIGSSWPIIWFGFDQVHEALVKTQEDGFGAKCLELLMTLFKGLAPVAFASIAIKSPAGQIVTKAAHATVAGGKTAFLSLSGSKASGTGLSQRYGGQIRGFSKGRNLSSVQKNYIKHSADRLASAKHKTSFGGFSNIGSKGVMK